MAYFRPRGLPMGRDPIGPGNIGIIRIPFPFEATPLLNISIFHRTETRRRAQSKSDGIREQREPGRTTVER